MGLAIVQLTLNRWRKRWRHNLKEEKKKDRYAMYEKSTEKQLQSTSVMLGEGKNKGK